jgi:hypothetical protein
LKAVGDSAGDDARIFDPAIDDASNERNQSSAPLI